MEQFHVFNDNIFKIIHSENTGIWSMGSWASWTSDHILLAYLYQTYESYYYNDTLFNKYLRDNI